MPSCARMAGGNEACVMRRGMLDQALHAAQALGQRKRWQRSRKRRASASPPRKPARDHAAEAACICRFASACCGWLGSPG